MAGPGEDKDKKPSGGVEDKQEPTAPTIEDLKKLQSEYDKKLAARDKELADLKGRPGGKAIVEDDFAVREAEEKLAKERGEFETQKVAWHRDRISSEYKIDPKELEKMTDPRDMELYAIKKTTPKSPKSGPGADREPSQTGGFGNAQDRLRSGLETRLKKMMTS